MDLSMKFEGKQYALYCTDVHKYPSMCSTGNVKILNAKKVVAHYVQTECLREKIRVFGKLGISKSKESLGKKEAVFK